MGGPTDEGWRALVGLRMAERLNTLHTYLGITPQQEGAWDAFSQAAIAMMPTEGGPHECGGRYGCEVVGDMLTGKLSQRDFQQLVSDTADRVDASELSRRDIRNAARSFWKALATDATAAG